MPDIVHQECPRCKQVYPYTSEYFHRDKSQHSGLKSRCKKCSIAAASGYYEDHRDDVLEAKRIHRIENRDMYLERDRQRYLDTIDYQHQRHADYRANNQDKVLEATRDWRRRNPDYIKAYSKRYYKDHAHAIRVKVKKYYRDHLEERLAYAKSRNAIRRTTEKSQGDGYSLADIRLQYRSQHGKCWHCGIHVGKKFHVDHLIPLRWGGKHDASNIVISCPFCNLSKKDKLCYQWNGRLF